MRRFLSSSLLLLLATGAFAGVRPAWVETAPRADADASIDQIVAGRTQDLVVVEPGLETGLRQGMVAEVTRGDTFKGRLLIADATAARAIALILELAPGQTLMAGDRVTRALVRL